MFVDLVLRVALPPDLFRGPLAGRVTVVLCAVLAAIVCAGLAALVLLQRLPTEPINLEVVFTPLCTTYLIIEARHV